MKILNTCQAFFNAAISLTLSIFLLTGCSIMQPAKTENITSYALDAEFEPATSSRTNMTLLVNTPKAQAGFNSTRMIYMKRAHEIDYFSRNQWVDSPARMLAPLLVQALEHTGHYRAVIHSRSAVKADLQLDTEIIRFQHEFLAQPSRIHLTLRAQLIDIHEKRVIATHEFDITEIATSDDPYGGVIATNHAVKKILLQIADFCMQEYKAGELSDTAKK